MSRSRIDKAKDAIDLALSIRRPASERSLKTRIDEARDIIEYIELHYTSNYQIDLEERRSQRRERSRKG